MRQRRNDERGASLIEYALLLALVAMICAAAVGVLGNSVDESLDVDIGVTTTTT